MGEGCLANRRKVFFSTCKKNFHRTHTPVCKTTGEAPPTPDPTAAPTPAPTAQYVMTYLKLDGVAKHEGTHLQSLSGKTEAECEKLCVDRSDCHSFAMCPKENKKENRCWLKGKWHNADSPLRYGNNNDPCSTYYECCAPSPAPTPAPTPLDTSHCNWACYVFRYQELQRQYGTNVEAAESHYVSTGHDNEMNCKCPDPEPTDPNGTYYIDIPTHYCPIGLEIKDETDCKKGADFLGLAFGGSVEASGGHQHCYYANSAVVFNAATDAAKYAQQADLSLSVCKAPGAGLPLPGEEYIIRPSSAQRYMRVAGAVRTGTWIKLEHGAEHARYVDTNSKFVLKYLGQHTYIIKPTDGTVYVNPHRRSGNNHHLQLWGSLATTIKESSSQYILETSGTQNGYNVYRVRDKDKSNFFWQADGDHAGAAIRTQEDASSELAKFVVEPAKILTTTSTSTTATSTTATPTTTTISTTTETFTTVTTSSTTTTTTTISTTTVTKTTTTTTTTTTSISTTTTTSSITNTTTTTSSTTTSVSTTTTSSTTKTTTSTTVTTTSTTTSTTTTTITSTSTTSTITTTITTTTTSTSSTTKTTTHFEWCDVYQGLDLPTTQPVNPGLHPNLADPRKHMQVQEGGFVGKHVTPSYCCFLCYSNPTCTAFLFNTTSQFCFLRTGVTRFVIAPMELHAGIPHDRTTTTSTTTTSMTTTSSTETTTSSTSVTGTTTDSTTTVTTTTTVTVTTWTRTSMTTTSTVSAALASAQAGTPTSAPPVATPGTQATVDASMAQATPRALTAPRVLTVPKPKAAVATLATRLEAEKHTSKAAPRSLTTNASTVKRSALAVHAAAVKRARLGALSTVHVAARAYRRIRLTSSNETAAQDTEDSEVADKEGEVEQTDNQTEQAANEVDDAESESSTSISPTNASVNISAAFATPSTTEASIPMPTEEGNALVTPFVALRGNFRLEIVVPEPEEPESVTNAEDDPVSDPTDEATQDAVEPGSLAAAEAEAGVGRTGSLMQVRNPKQEFNLHLEAVKAAVAAWMGVTLKNLEVCAVTPGDDIRYVSFAAIATSKNQALAIGHELRSVSLANLSSRITSKIQSDNGEVIHKAKVTRFAAALSTPIAGNPSNLFAQVGNVKVHGSTLEGLVKALAENQGTIEDCFLAAIDAALASGERAAEVGDWGEKAAWMVSGTGDDAAKARDEATIESERRCRVGAEGAAAPLAESPDVSSAEGAFIQLGAGDVHGRRGLLRSEGF
eukprot:TRINITY_DN10495_c0_g2_i2.p1 TRINITY_DN10495_c0_g2~~TRINITY_DN10495_c0_g2_i2.p1  ORF type:complete len:1377 (-),score=173.77 TRINITY_DN10495_c0_g2_i2:57-3797(-)